MRNGSANASSVMTLNKQDTILALKGVSKQFGGLRAVDNVNLSIHQGALHCLIGPNGAGKSTIFKMIMGLYPPTKGQIDFKGKEITSLKTWQRAGLGLSIKMQIPGVYDGLSARDNIRIAAQNHVDKPHIEEEINHLLELVGIPNFGNETVSNLSHGQQQWLEIAMALASKPDMLLLDEPAAGMGPEETEFTAQLIRKLNEQGVTILFIDHDMEFVRRIAQKVTVLHYGSIFAEGTISEIESHEGVIQIYLGKA